MYLEVNVYTHNTAYTQIQYHYILLALTCRIKSAHPHTTERVRVSGYLQGGRGARLHTVQDSICTYIYIYSVESIQV